MQDRRLGPAIRRHCPDQNIVRRRFGVIDLDVEETIVRERVRVPELELALHF